MEQIAAEQAAFVLMKEAANGDDISRRYNSLTPDEQRHVFSEMKNIQLDPQTMNLFGNVDLFDSNNDGRMDNASSVKGHEKLDVYDSVQSQNKKDNTVPQPARQAETQSNTNSNDSSPNAPFRQLSRTEISRDPYLRQADILLNRASRGQDIYDGMQRFGNDPRMLEAMKAVQQNKPEYQNVRLVDSNGDGVLDDVRSVTRAGQEVDVYKTREDAAQERVQRTGGDAMRRGGEIVADEVFRGMRQGSQRVPMGERIGDRMQREGVNGAQRVLRDVLRGR